MPIAIDRWKSDLACLSSQERAELARFLIDSLDDVEEADANAAWDAEIGRRVEEIRGGGVAGKPAEQVLAEIREKCA